MALMSLSEAGESSLCVAVPTVLGDVAAMAFVAFFASAAMDA